MLNGVLLLSVLTVSTLSSSKTESRKTSASKDICKNRCPCEERENLLNINCENKGFTTVSLFQAPPNKISQLFLNGNFLSRLHANEFVHYGNVTSLHLGNNGLQDIRTGAFNGLRYLKRLHLNNNNLEVIKEDTFAGLESLEYLQADYNYISAIEPGAFSKLNKLKVLILNDNLLLSLPTNVFRFVLLTHLDLRGNRLKTLPFAGVLEHIGGIMEIQLEENPWNCTCDLIPLKSWLDTISVFVGDIVCETPFRLHGKDITQLIKQDLCPRRNAGERVIHPPSDSHILGGPPPPTFLPGMITPTRIPKASRPPKMRHRPTPRVNSKDKHVFGPIMVYQTRSPVPMLCPSVCVCTSQNPESGLNINCQERKLHNISELNPKPSYPKKLHLTGNYLQVIYRNDLTEYSSLELLHLGNNRIAVIQQGSFENLTNLRRLYLNGNYIESLSHSLFVGLQSLQYLYLEYNIIKEILPQTFNDLHNLQLLFLNNNLLRALPDSVFGGTMLTRLNLRNNHFSRLPVHGVLDQLSAFIQIDLQENPWDCTCDLVALKNWMELSSTSVVVNEITCDSPSKHAGRLLRSLRNEAICPEPSETLPTPQQQPPTREPTAHSPGTEAPPAAAAAAAAAGSSPSSSSSSSTTSASTYSPPPPTESHLYPPELHPEVPLSVLILGLLVVFILSVCFGAGLFVFVLKRRKGMEHVPAGGNNLDLNSFQVQYGSYAAEPAPDKSSESHVYNYIPPPMGSMCQNPIYMQKDGEQVAFYRNLKELSFGPLDAKKDERLARSPGAYAISTVDFMDKSLAQCGVAVAPEPPELLYQNLAERSHKELPAAGGLPPFSYNFCTLPKRPCIVPPYEAASVRRLPANQEHLNKTVLYGTPRKYYGAEQPSKNNDHPLLLPGKLKTDLPDYLEVLEKHTAMSQL
ncbi:SLIT and NTRK-like protein 2 isoform X1 [Gadus chalcogrammus]|uniref:SLIT and NTRK-like protein 2 isoform X1 n=1 Tax=Gadus chalcogrammus TaxID=1042646 RepID=UPI0024C4BD09|nr:SLIT and NTRK-like protein 2 isoform X1 [Gadus chalcogrammus]